MEKNSGLLNSIRFQRNRHVESAALIILDNGIEMQTIIDGGGQQALRWIIGKLMSAGMCLQVGETLFMTAFTNTVWGRMKDGC